MTSHVHWIENSNLNNLCLLLFLGEGRSRNVIHITHGLFGETCLFFKQTIHTSSSPYSHKSGTLSRRTAQDHPPAGGNHYPTERIEWNLWGLFRWMRQNQEMWLWWPCCHVSSRTFFPLNHHGNETYMANNITDQIPNRPLIGMTFHHDYPNDMSHVFVVFFRGQPASLWTPKSGDHRITQFQLSFRAWIGATSFGSSVPSWRRGWYSTCGWLVESTKSNWESIKPMG